MLLRARIVLPICQPAIMDGAVLISGEQIRAVGRWQHLSRKFRGEAIDLGEVLLMPGLVNAHCHLDYTSMAGQFPPPKVFTDWLKLITTTKAEFSYSEFAESWLTGAKMLLRNGTTTVGDIETVPELLPDVLDATPLRIISFLEMTGIRSRREPKVILQETCQRVEALSVRGARAGLSPHAPYSTLPELLRLSADTARRRAWPIAIHVAESIQEFDMFMRGRGEMYDWLKRNERDMSDCGLGSPIQHLERCRALTKNLLAIHVNYLAKKDVSLLARRGVTVVHCPRSHSFFRHEGFPYKRLARAGINICLGTDSLASVYQQRRQPADLNLFEEMRAFAVNSPSVRPRRVLDLVTVNGAKALGLKNQAGQLSKGSFADLIALPFHGTLSSAYDAVLQHPGQIAASMINGKWVIAPESG
jgi:cytosine/adenosine deaminase-related metal-dependent hydrolase